MIMEASKEGIVAHSIKLTGKILETILPGQIIYAEIAVDGAMGNAGGILIYVVKDSHFTCYETSIFTNEEVYKLAVMYISNNEKQFFKFYYGGFGNDVFIKKDAELKIKQAYFEYTEHGKKYKIISSARGVFDRVVDIMNNHS